MSQGYLGEIRIFAGTYAPVDWAFCNGAVLPVAGNEPLFALIGPTYGGNGATTFALPDLRGRVPVGYGAGVGGLTSRALGATGGAETVTLSMGTTPPHTHPVTAISAPALSKNPAGEVFASAPDTGGYYVGTGDADITLISQLNSQTIGVAPATPATPHQNMMPAMALNYIICTVGQYPDQSN